MVIVGSIIKDLENSFLLSKKFVMTKNNMPDRVNDNAVVNFIVTHVGERLFKISMSKNHPAITMEPIKTRVMPNAVVISFV